MEPDKLTEAQTSQSNNHLRPRTVPETANQHEISNFKTLKIVTIVNN